MSINDIYHWLSQFIDENKEKIMGKEYIRVDWLEEEIDELFGK